MTTQTPPSCNGRHAEPKTLTSHEQDLIALAQRVDAIVAAITQNGPWTNTPGRDALRALHPELARHITTQAVKPMNTSQAAQPVPTIHEPAAQAHATDHAG